LALGYVLMTAARSIAFLLPSVVIRSLGSAALWIYSTLILQFRVPNDIQGAILAHIRERSSCVTASYGLYFWGQVL